MDEIEVDGSVILTEHHAYLDNLATRQVVVSLTISLENKPFKKPIRTGPYTGSHTVSASAELELEEELGAGVLIGSDDAGAW